MGIGHTIKCDQVVLNDGNGYNPYAGVFIVPQTGVYLLTFSLDSATVNIILFVKLVVNNRTIASAAVHVAVHGHSVMEGNTVIVRLSKGVSVWLETCGHSNSHVYGSSSNRFTTFSGVLLYA